MNLILRIFSKNEKGMLSFLEERVEMKKYVLINSGVLFIGLLIIVLVRNDASVLGGFVKLIGLSLTLIGAFLLILYFFGITLNRLQ
ncbi:MAG TPA: hypothetical protein DSN98_06825 [Thermoplasmata archaeon]|nr:MAG TPA: hypothetical protein DSN98_06825 [Thermoplasmata archaeon]